VAYNDYGAATSAAATLTVETAARLINLSTRSQVGTGSDVLVAGFSVTGDKPRTLLIRGVGDQLSQFDVHGVLRDPFLELFNAKSAVIASSDDWASGDDFDADRLARIDAIRAAEKSTGAFALRSDTRDAALIATLDPGLYSAQVSGLSNTTGIGLIEIYEVGDPSMNRLINLSCRSQVGTGDNALFVGFGIKGSAKRRLLVRAVGPGLGVFHIAGTLADPQLTVYRGTTPIATNDNWGDAGASTVIKNAQNQVGAFPLPVGSADAAIILDLEPGLYSCKVSGAGDTTGIALVEVYEVPN
jgi:hypothetical protein